MKDITLKKLFQVLEYIPKVNIPTDPNFDENRRKFNNLYSRTVSHMTTFFPASCTNAYTSGLAYDF